MLLWVCDDCGRPEPVLPEGSYVEGDHEPCIYCEDGVARVKEFPEIASWPACEHCDSDLSVCFGRYEDMEQREFACDECCGHGCEDGECEQLTTENVLEFVAERERGW
jgi:hypothetical protein